VANIPMADNVYARDVTRVPVGGTVRFPNEEVKVTVPSLVIRGQRPQPATSDWSP
jgi:hypothetical protein